MMNSRSRSISFCLFYHLISKICAEKGVYVILLNPCKGNDISTFFQLD